MQAEFGDYTGAIKNLEKANALKPDSYEFRYNLGLAYHRNGDPGHALQILEPLRQQRDDSEIENLLGEVYEKKGQYLEAVRASKEPRNASRQTKAIVLILSTNFSSTRVLKPRLLPRSRPFATFPSR